MKDKKNTRLWIWVIAVIIIIFLFLFSMFHLPQRGKVVSEEELVENIINAGSLTGENIA